MVTLSREGTSQLADALLCPSPPVSSSPASRQPESPLAVKSVASRVSICPRGGHAPVPQPPPGSEPQGRRPRGPALAACQTKPDTGAAGYGGHVRAGGGHGCGAGRPEELVRTGQTRRPRIFGQNRGGPLAGAEEGGQRHPVSLPRGSQTRSRLLPPSRKRSRPRVPAGVRGDEISRGPLCGELGRQLPGSGLNAGEWHSPEGGRSRPI